MTKVDRPPPVHPGEVLREEYLAPLGITPYALAAALRLSRTHVESLVRGEISVTSSTALRLAGYFGTSPEFWLSIQARFDEHAMKLPAVLTQCYAKPLGSSSFQGLMNSAKGSRERVDDAQLANA